MKFIPAGKIKNRQPEVARTHLPILKTHLNKTRDLLIYKNDYIIGSSVGTLFPAGHSVTESQIAESNCADAWSCQTYVAILSSISFTHKHFVVHKELRCTARCSRPHIQSINRKIPLLAPRKSKNKL